MPIMSFNNIPTKPTTIRPPTHKPLPSKGSNIPTAKELNEKFPLEVVTKKNAEKVYWKYIYPNAETGYQIAYLPIRSDSPIEVLNDEKPLPRDIELFFSLQQYLEKEGYKTTIIKKEMRDNIGVKYFGMTIEW